jgi:bifunctional UDP-N-acetylglucosamine pyrophosphorylase/glucosamine-1-phosphate N-acetyltransferase
MHSAGINNFLFVVGYHDEQIRSYFGSGSAWTLIIQYSNQIKQMGTAAALNLVKDLIHEDFLMANGDVLINHQDISLVMEQPGIVMSVIELKDVSGLGVIEGQHGQVTRIHEKVLNPPTHIANAGLYRFTPDIFKAIDSTGMSTGVNMRSLIPYRYSSTEV